MDTQSYLNQIQNQLRITRPHKQRKAEQEVLKVVNEFISNGKATTIKELAQTLNKKPQHIHQIVRDSTLLKKVYTGKTGKRVVVLPTESTDEMSSDDLQDSHDDNSKQNAMEQQ